MKATGGAKAFLLIGTLLVALVLLSPFFFSLLSLVAHSELVFDPTFLTLKTAFDG